MNGVGRRGLKFASIILMIFAVLIFGAMIIFMVLQFIRDHYISSDLYAIAGGAFLTIICGGFVFRQINNYKVGKGSPINFVSLMFLLYNALSYYYFLSTLLAKTWTYEDMILEGFGIYLFLLIATLVIILVSTLGNIIKNRFVICLGNTLSTLTYANFVIWFVVDYINGKSFLFWYIYPQIAYPIIIGALLSAVIIAITSFVMIFSVFSKRWKQYDAKIGKVNKVNICALMVKAHEKGYITKDVLDETINDLSKKESKQLYALLDSKEGQERFEEAINDPHTIEMIEKSKADYYQRKYGKSEKEVVQEQKEAPKVKSPSDEIDELLRKNEIE